MLRSNNTFRDKTKIDSLIISITYSWAVNGEQWADFKSVHCSRTLKRESGVPFLISLVTSLYLESRAITALIWNIQNKDKISQMHKLSFLYSLLQILLSCLLIVCCQEWEYHLDQIYRVPSLSIYVFPQHFRFTLAESEDSCQAQIECNSSSHVNNRIFCPFFPWGQNV